MLLRSSSTPLLGSLLPPDPVGKPSPSSFTFHCNTVSSPAAASLHSDHHRPSAAFRRTNSEGNLNTLSHAPDSVEDSSFDSFISKPNHLRRSPLQSIPSFSFYGSRGTVEEEEEEDDHDHDEDEDEDEGCFHIKNGMESAILTPEVRAMEQAWTRVASGNEMYLVRGIGIGTGLAGAGGSGGGRRPGSSGSGGGGGGGEQQGMEDYYRKMIVENPGNALVLTNYAEFLYQWKGDLVGAEEYYSRAILMDSKDGKVLSKYAKLVWELYHDQLKASSYFQLAIQASPHDSHVQAAYANFLWEIEDDEEDDDIVKEMVTQTCRAAATA